MAGIADRIAGKWRIVETAAWDKQHLDLWGPAFLVFDRQGRGEVAFGALDAAHRLQLHKGDETTFIAA